MPEIVSLRDYHEQIDELLDERRFDEVIFHCQHILQQRPKDIGAYRRLGRAFIALDQWEETGEVLRRVLSVSPDDLQAHLGLSRVYHYTKKPIQAIWHLERAWEHEPNNIAMSEELRQMYFVHRKIEDARLQLTVGAAARQYARNGLYDQAISLLANTLRQARDRVDLRLLLARIQREGGHAIDSAETALDIVAILPDCVEANSILAELWLQEKRPSDAQRYLSRIEAVDPYLAVQLVTNRPTTQEFDVTLGDYHSVATRQSTQAQPDWLTALGDDGADVGVDDDDFFANLLDDEPTDEEKQTSPLSRQSGLLGSLPQTSEWADSDGDDSWLTNDLDAQTELNIDINRKATGLTGLLTTLDEGDSALAGDNEFDLPSMDEFFNDSDELDDPLSWLNEPDQDADVPVASRDDDDPFGWLKDSGIEVDEDSDNIRFSSAPVDDGPTNFSTDIAADPMAWLKDSGHEVIDNDDNPMAWLDNEDDDDAFDFFTETTSQSSEPSFAEPDFDTFDHDDETLLDEMLAMEDLFAENEDSNEIKFSQPITEDDASAEEFTFDLDDEIEAEEDPLSWLTQASEETAIENEIEDEETAVAEDTPSWLLGADLEDDASAEEFTFDLDDEIEAEEDPLSWLTQASEETAVEIEIEEEETAVAEDTPSWLLGDDAEDDASVEEFTFDLDDEIEAEEDPLSWLTQASEETAVENEIEDEETVVAEDTPSWLLGADDAEDDASADEFTFDLDDEIEAEEDPLSWLTQASEETGVETEEETAVAEDTPSWLLGADDAEDDANADEFTFDLDDEIEAEEDPLSWLTQASEETVIEIEEETVVAEDTPLWLLGADDAEDDASAEEFTFDLDDEIEAEEDPLSWLTQASEETVIEIEDEETAVAEDTPSWLLGDDDAEDDTSADEFTFDLDDEPLDIEGVINEPLFAKDEPEAPVYWQVGDDEKQDDTFSFEVEDAPDWLDDVLDEDINELEIDHLEEPVLKSTDWLTGIADQASDSFALDDDEQEEISTFDFADEQVGSVEENFGWLDILQEPEPEPIIEEVIDETPSQPTDEQNASDVPDWLLSNNDNEGEELDLFTESDPKAEPESTDDELESTPDWLSSDDESDDLEDLFAFEQDTPAETFSFTENSEDTPDWLSDLEADDEESEDEFDFFTEAETAVESIVDEAPDWLLEDDGDDEESESEFDFFTEAESAVETAVESVVNETPDWLSDLEADDNDDESEDEFDFFTEAESDVETAVESVMNETPDWLLDDDADDDESEDEFDFFTESETAVETAVSETPDWLLEDDGDDEESEDEFDFFTEAESAVETAVESVVNETPDWLLEDDADDEELEDEFDFFTEAESAVETAVVNETPEWLLEDDANDEESESEFDFFTEAETESAVESIVSETPDWLLEDDGDDEESESEFDFFTEAETESAVSTSVSETPDWLLEDDADDEESEDEFEFFTEAESAVETAVESVVNETPDWLLEDDADDEELEDEFEFFTEAESAVESAVSDTPDWLLDDDADDDDESELIEEEYNVLGETEDHPAEIAPETPDWLSEESEDEFDFFTEAETTVESAVESFVSETPDWLLEDDADDDESELIEEEYNVLGETEDHPAEVAPETPDWLLDDQAEDAESEFEELEFVPEEIGDEPSEEYIPAAAQNAPDWLNAMVPGFDVDFEADEDAPVESEFLTATKQAAVAREAASVDFGWLDEIVEAEMYQRPSISLDALPGLSKSETVSTSEPDAPATNTPAIDAPAPPKKPSRFSFSRPPAGLRKQSEPQPAPKVDDDDLPDWLTEDNNSPDIDNDFFNDDALLDETDLFSDDIFAGSIEGDRLSFDKDEDDDDLFDDDLFTPRG